MVENPQIELARDFVEHTGTNIFLTGRAGTGKTTFLRRLREHSPKRMIVVAPTGVAAINAGGVTMHSFFQLPFGVWLPGIRRQGHNDIKRFSKTKIAIIKSLDLLVIDEISMVRADLLDNVDDVLRRFRDRTKPFGGVQLLMIGDLQQLAPVVKDDEWTLLKNYYRSPYFFDSTALRQTSYISIELQHIYRQSDPSFIGLLSRVRENSIDGPVLQALNARHRPHFNPPQSEGYITLCSHNAAARAINDRKLEELAAEPLSFEAKVDGQFPEHLYPAEQTLVLKEGAQVMFCKNDVQAERRYVNGTIGTVTRLTQDYVEVLPAGAEEPLAVTPAEWENLSYSIDPATREITEQVDGMFTQYPLKTAWAITIHKSQGLTFDRAIIDAADSFSHGQVYVALSRCRTLEGIVLSTPLSQNAIISDGTVRGFTDWVAHNQPGAEELEERKRGYFSALLDEQFDFKELNGLCSSIVRFAEQHLWRLYPKTVEKWTNTEKEFRRDVFDVSLRFRAQAARLTGDGYASDAHLAGRITKAAGYFTEKCSPLIIQIKDTAGLEVDSKENKKLLADLSSQFIKALRVKLSTLSTTGEGFTVKGYLDAKAAAITDTETSPKEKFKTPKADKQPKREEGDILNPELFALLRKWRHDLSQKQGTSAFVIASTKTLVTIANTLPRNAVEIEQIKGVGKTFIRKYAPQVLAIVGDFIDGKISAGQEEFSGE